MRAAPPAVSSVARPSPRRAARRPDRPPTSGRARGGSWRAAQPPRRLGAAGRTRGGRRRRTQRPARRDRAGGDVVAIPTFASTRGVVAVDEQVGALDQLARTASRSAGTPRSRPTRVLPAHELRRAAGTGRDDAGARSARRARRAREHAARRAASPTRCRGRPTWRRRSTWRRRRGTRSARAPASARTAAAGSIHAAGLRVDRSVDGEVVASAGATDGAPSAVTMSTNAAHAVGGPGCTQPSAVRSSGAGTGHAHRAAPTLERSAPGRASAAARRRPRRVGELASGPAARVATPTGVAQPSHARPSFAGEARRSLLEEGGDALGAVVGGRDQEVEVGLEPQRVGEGEVAAALHRVARGRLRTRARPATSCSARSSARATGSASSTASPLRIERVGVDRLADHEHAQRERDAAGAGAAVGCHPSTAARRHRPRGRPSSRRVR